MVAVPGRLEQRVAEAERQQVAHRFLAEVMVDPVHLRLVEVAMDQCVQRLRRYEVAAERFLDHQPRPAGAAVEARQTERFDRPGERAGRQREVEHAVARQCVVGFDRRDPITERLVGGRAGIGGRLVVEIAVAPVGDVAGRLVPRLLQR